MKLAPVSFSNIPLGRPLPFGLHNADGTLLASRGYVFTEREALDTLAAHGTLFVDPQEVRQYRWTHSTCRRTSAPRLKHGPRLVGFRWRR